MADRNNSRKMFSAEETLKTEIIVNQALIDILIAKQVISEEELVASIQKIRREQKPGAKDPSNLVRLKR